ncbi:MAG TPA: PD-(D/E)XK nuclease family protein [Candidatus Anoxymicrobiaceae bacterium]|jgi:RecB family exonuclease
MKLSYTEISTYQTCPLQYRFRYVEARPTEPSPSLSFGKSVHSALEWLYSTPTPDAPLQEQLIERLETCWVSEGYASSEEETRYFYQAKATLEHYYRRYVQGGPGAFKLPAALEYKFRVDLGFCELSGVIDRLDRDNGDGFEIIDYKTNRRLPPARRLAGDLQLPLYHIAAERIWEIPVNKVTFHYLLIDHRHSMHVTPQRVEEALAEVESVAGCIERGELNPQQNNLCPWCDFLEDCPLMSGKVQSRRGSTASPALDIGQAVDELVITHDQVAHKLARVEGLKSIVAAYLEDKGVDSVSGSQGLAFYDEDGHLSWRDI